MARISLAQQLVQSAHQLRYGTKLTSFKHFFLFDRSVSNMKRTEVTAHHNREGSNIPDSADSLSAPLALPSLRDKAGEPLLMPLPQIGMDSNFKPPFQIQNAESGQVAKKAEHSKLGEPQFTLSSLDTLSQDHAANSPTTSQKMTTTHPNNPHNHSHPDNRPNIQENTKDGQPVSGNTTGPSSYKEAVSRGRNTQAPSTQTTTIRGISKLA